MMQPDETLIELINKASAAAGNDYKLAKQISQPPQRISDWRAGRKPCPVEDQAIMAAVAHLDPLMELARAVVRKHEGTIKGDQLMRALGKGLAATGAVLASAGANAAAIFSTTPTSRLDLVEVAGVIYTMCRRLIAGNSNSRYVNRYFTAINQAM